MRSIVIGTAGHIDHGKSALVQALTGTDPDRLPEEKRRGITIDLGFADLQLGEFRIGFVDVPGHERFVKNMLAGVHGIDAVLLVIAADEGVMPQTREHFDICRLLNVRHGLVALTKTDLVEDELLSLVRAEAEELVAGSFLDGSPTIGVSARTGAGLDELRDALIGIAEKLPARSSEFVTRLPIDRAFTIKGFGAVVTGTLVSGEISETSELELMPTGRRVRVRGVQVHGSPVPRALPGQRTAVNLAGVDVAGIERGMVLAEPAQLRPSQIIDVQLAVLASAPRPLRTRARLRVHLGSAEVLARVRVLNDRREIAPGETDFAQLRLEAPVVAVHDERFIVRSYSPAATIAGGIVLDPMATKYRSKNLAKTRERLAGLLNSERSLKAKIFAESTGESGLRFTDLAARTGWNDAVLQQVLHEPKVREATVEIEGILVAKENFELLSRQAMDQLNAHHKREPLSRGLPRQTLRERAFAHAPAEIFRAVISGLEKDGRLVSDKDLVRAVEHSLELSTGDAEVRDKLSAVYEAAGLEAPSLDQALQQVGLPANQRAHGRKILQVLIDNKTLVRVHDEMFLHATAVARLRRLLADYASAHEPERLIDVPSFKELAGVSRKYAIPLLEYLDSERITRRAGDRRFILA
ncbi:MAG TPA: selenocysteine-specific translation elongation factor [Pyrinomonadaceae bacterium]|nr:selenocysteine-specific translation elongation factor [Pyrinomonadaceae bacterium]